MKKGILLLSLLVTLSYLGWGQRTLPATEQFDYSTGQLATVGTNWSRFSGTGNDLAVIDGNLFKNGYLASVGRMVALTNGAADDVKLTFTSQSAVGTKIYAAFVLSVLNQTGISTGTYSFILGSGTSSFASRLYIKSSGSGFVIGVSKTSTAPTSYSSELACATSHLIVFAYEIVSGATNDIASLWINPVITSSAPTADFSSTSGTDFGGGSAIDAFMFRQAPGSANANIDNISISTSWSDLFLNPTFTSSGNLGAGTYTNLSVSGASSALTLNGNITLNGTFSLSDGSLSLNSNTLTYGGSSILKYNGSSAQTTSSSELPSSGGPNSLTIDNSSGVNLGGNVTIAGTLLINSGKIFTIGDGRQVTVTGTLTNSAGNTGLVIESGGSLLYNGPVSATVKRYIANASSWHFLSSPVSGQTICDGNFAPSTGNFNETNGLKYNFFQWSESVAISGQPWINLKNESWGVNTAFGDPPVFDVKKGYLLEYISDFGQNTTKSFAGTLNSGDQTVSLTHAGNTWNLIGNPFPSAIDWGVITKGNLASTYCYIYNPSKSGGAGYEAYASGNIAAMQGFFVEASGSSLSLPNSARVHGGSWLKNTEVSPLNQLKIKLGNAANYDETSIMFAANGTMNKGWYDAHKLLSMSAEVPQVYTLKDIDTKICINSLPFINDPLTVPVGMYIPSDGNYTLELSGLESFPSVPGILLEDLKTHATRNMVETPVYNFSASTSDDAARFLLHFSGPIGISEKPGNHDFLIFASDNALFVLDNTGKNQGNVFVYNMMGQLLASSKMNGNSTIKLNMDVPAGYYIVKVVAPETTQSSKVFIR